MQSQAVGITATHSLWMRSGAVRFPASAIPSALAIPVSYIVGVRAKEKMIRVYASRVVAFVANAKCGPFPEMNEPRNPVRPPRFTNNADSSVSSANCVSIPIPATFCLLEAGEKL